MKAVMTGRRPYTRFLILLLVVALTACGPGAQQGGGIGGTGSIASVSSGTVTGFGSVFVSGDEFDTTYTMFQVDRQEGVDQNQLKKGMVVVVDATVLQDNASKKILQRTAIRIVYTDTVEGPVQAVAPDGHSLAVLGQTVLVTGTTIIDGSVPGQDVTRLTPDVDLLEISGFVLGDGVIVATLIERKAGSPDYEIKGFVKNHDADHNLFQIGALTVHYGGADISLMPSPNGNAWNGLPIDALGDGFSLPHAGQPDGVLTATRIAPETIGNQDSRLAEIEGFVTQVLSPSEFFVGNIRVRIDADTQFEGGTPSDIGPGVRLEVDGLLSNHVLTAARVEFNDRIKLESDIATISSPDGISGTVTLAGFPNTIIRVNSQTRFKGQGAPTQLGDLQAGAHITVRGEPLDGGALATEITVLLASGSVVFQGPLDSAANPLLVIMNSTIDTSAIPDTGFRDAGDSPIGRSAFFNSLVPGLIVELEGTWLGGAIQWREAELQQ